MAKIELMKERAKKILDEQKNDPNWKPYKRAPKKKKAGKSKGCH